MPYSRLISALVKTRPSEKHFQALATGQHTTPKFLIQPVFHSYLFIVIRKPQVQQAASVQIRVNGIPIQQVRLWVPQNNPKLVIVDPLIGCFEIDDRDQRFHVEVLDLDIPAKLRAQLVKTHASEEFLRM
jgi:hypothetical protein